MMPGSKASFHGKPSFRWDRGLLTRPHTSVRMGKTMCTRYYVELSPELRPIIEAARHSSLAAKMVHDLGRPVITEGEVKPTDIAPVIAVKCPGGNSRSKANLQRMLAAQALYHPRILLFRMGTPDEAGRHEGNR